MVPILLTLLKPIVMAIIPIFLLFAFALIFVILYFVTKNRKKKQV